MKKFLKGFTLPYMDKHYIVVSIRILPSVIFSGNLLSKSSDCKTVRQMFSYIVLKKNLKLGMTIIF